MATDYYVLIETTSLPLLCRPRNGDPFEGRPLSPEGKEEEDDGAVGRRAEVKRDLIEATTIELKFYFSFCDSHCPQCLRNAEDT